MKERRPAVFLDRDGVLNALVDRDGGRYSPRRSQDFTLFPWTREALDILHEQEYLLVVVTNQPDVARGHMTVETLDEMHVMLRSSVPIDGIYVCTHDSSDGCDCRKPLPGMFLRAAREWNIDLQSSWTIGDRATDIDAGRAAGTRLIHVSSGQEDTLLEPDVVSVKDLLSAAQFVAKNATLS